MGILKNSTSESGLLHASGHGAAPMKCTPQVGIPQAAKPVFRLAPGCCTGIVAPHGLQVLRNPGCAQALLGHMQLGQPSVELDAQPVPC